MSTFRDLHDRPRFPEYRDYYNGHRNMTHHGVVCSLGPLDHLAGTALVFIPTLNNTYTVYNHATSYSSTNGVGEQKTLVYGDAVTIAFEDGDSSRGYITAVRPHFNKLTEYVKDNYAPQVGTTFQDITLHPKPIGQVTEAVRYGYTGQATVYPVFLT